MYEKTSRTARFPVTPIHIARNVLTALYESLLYTVGEKNT